MDYKFYRELGGQAIAECEPEVSTFGDCLTLELSKNESEVSGLLKVIEKLQSKQLTSHKVKWNDFTLILSQDEAELHTHVGYWDSEEDLPEGTELDTQGEQGCGLQDLKELLTDWYEFLCDK
jgi:uncharacterized protein YacL (UPF0231 family)